MTIRYVIAPLIGVAASLAIAAAAGAATPSGAATTSTAATSPSVPVTSTSTSTVPPGSPTFGIGGLAQHPAAVVGSGDVLPGGSVEIRSTGWPAHRHATVTFDGGRLIASLPTGTGTIDGHVTIPSTATSGGHELNLLVHTDASTPGEQNTFDDVADVRITIIAAQVAVDPTTIGNGPASGIDGPSTTTDGLAFTGGHTAGLAGAGTLLLGAGVGLTVFASRRRELRRTH